LNWNVLLPTDPDTCRGKLGASDYAAAHGARVLALSYPGPMNARVSFLTSAFDAIPGWSETMALPPDELAAVLADPHERERLKKLAAQGDAATFGLTRFEDLRVLDTYTDDTRPYEGRRLGDLARELGRDVFDLLCDLGVADVRTGFSRAPIGDDPTSWSLRVGTWRDPRVVIGASDAGAHVDMLSTFDYAVALLAMARERHALPLEEVVRLLTDVPASLYRITGRGRVVDGAHADLVIFDPARVQDKATFANPHQYSQGFDFVLVNGRIAVDEGKLSSARGGRPLRRR